MVLAPGLLSLCPMHFFLREICWQKYRLVHLVNVSCLSMGTQDVDKFQKAIGWSWADHIKNFYPRRQYFGQPKEGCVHMENQTALTPFAQNKKEAAMGLKTVSHCFRLRAARSRECAP